MVMDHGEGATRGAAKVAALIPAYCEQAHIGTVVQRTRAQLRDVLVIDDGSEDQTAALAREAGAEVLAHPRNAGKGAAIKTGFRTLLARGFDYVIILDGDGQHRPEEIPLFLQAAALENQAGLIIGDRMGDTATMPRVRLLTNRFMSWQISRLCGRAIADTQCGFRMVHRSVIPSLFGQCEAYDYETEMILLASRAGHAIASVPITTLYGDEKSKIRALRDGYRFFRLLARYAWCSASE